MTELYDVVVFGATGVAGREVVRHLGRRAPALGVRWAVAGRDAGRVREVAESVSARPDGVLEADTSDAASIDRLAASARVLLNLVGPYSRHGEVVYEACIRHGVTELDLTGELDWVAEMVDAHGEAAAAAGARIIPVSGFESLPFDLAARFCAEAAHARTGRPVEEVDVALSVTARAPVLRPADAVSGGTWASALGMLERGPSRATTDAHALDPPGPDAGGSRPFRPFPRRHAGTGTWLAPMLPSPVLNPPVAHRTAALLRADGDPVFSPAYQYREGIAVPGPLGPVAAGALAGVGGIFAGLSRAPRVVRGAVTDVLGRLGPKPGQGPREWDLDRWSYRLAVTATTADGATTEAVVDALGHPGYKSTSTMVAEAALLLADRALSLPARTGFLTPATALGTEHLARFAHAGLTFRLV